jgi:nuclear cap-binding protein subunit 2
MMVDEVSKYLFSLISGGWGHLRLEEERRRQEQEKVREQFQVETYAAPADIPRGEGDDERYKRDRSEDDAERRDDDKRFRGE